MAQAESTPSREKIHVERLACDQDKRVAARAKQGIENSHRRRRSCFS
jgi:hypothetical protein